MEVVGFETDQIDLMIMVTTISMKADRKFLNVFKAI